MPPEHPRPNRKQVAFQKAKHWYARFERPISTLSGFLFDILTLKRVDAFWDNIWVVAHMVLLAICIILINRQETEPASEQTPDEAVGKVHFWLTASMQFLFGGLLSTFIVFYFRGAALAVAWPFLLVLVLAFVLNERFRKYYSHMEFQIGFFFLCIYLFAIFIVPIMMHTIGDTVFLISGGMSVGALLTFLVILKLTTPRFGNSNNVKTMLLVLGITIVINVLYFANIMPPLPLSLRDAGVYHDIVRNADGNYAISEEPTFLTSTLQKYFNIYPTYHISSDGVAYAYSAIFSPVSLNITVIHEWQKYDDSTKAWLTMDQIPLTVIGGREQGYRTYSTYRKLDAGLWRVNVKTESDQLIGRMQFNVISQASDPVLRVEIKN